ncbi:Gypsy retrotransposon integrase-like protein 1, partial [Cryomyces antarcticus]
MADRGFANNAGLNTGQGPVEISTSIAGTREIASTAGSQSSHPEVKLDAGSQLEIANSGRQNFRGHCSGFAFLTQMQQKYGDLLIPEAGPSTTVTIRFDLPQVFDSPLSLGKQGPIIPPPLPPKTVAVDLIECALEN